MIMKFDIFPAYLKHKKTILVHEFIKCNSRLLL